MIFCALTPDGQPPDKEQIEALERLHVRASVERANCALTGGHEKGRQVRKDPKWLCKKCNVVLYQ